MLTIDEKAAKFDQLQKLLWDMAKYGNTFQSTVAAAFIRTAEIESPEGDDPESAVLPCPFCGCRDILVHETAQGRVMLQCLNCGAQGPNWDARAALGSGDESSGH